MEPGMDTLGEFLQNARKSKGDSLDAVATKTRINTVYKHPNINLDIVKGFQILQGSGDKPDIAARNFTVL